VVVHCCRYPPDVIAQADELMEDFAILDSILARWQSRAFLPEMPFPKEFFYSTESRSSRKAEKQKDKRKEKLKNRWNAGFYVCVLFQTRDDGREGELSCGPTHRNSFPEGNVI